MRCFWIHSETHRIKAEIFIMSLYISGNAPSRFPSSVLMSQGKGKTHMPRSNWQLIRCQCVEYFRSALPVGALLKISAIPLLQIYTWLFVYKLCLQKQFCTSWNEYNLDDSWAEWQNGKWLLKANQVYSASSQPNEWFMSKMNISFNDVQERTLLVERTWQRKLWYKQLHLHLLYISTF